MVHKTADTHGTILITNKGTLPAAFHARVNKDHLMSRNDDVVAVSDFENNVMCHLINIATCDGLGIC